MSWRPPASISVLRRARTRSPTPAWLPSASGACGGPTVPSWASLAWTRRDSSAASALDPASSSTSLPRRWSASHMDAARSQAASSSAPRMRPCRS